MTVSKHINTPRGNLITRGTSYSVRKVMPSDVRHFVGQQEFKLSIGKMGKCSAIRRVNEISADFDEMIKDAREVIREGNNPYGIFTAFVSRHKNTVTISRMSGSTGGIHTIQIPEAVTFTSILEEWKTVKGKDDTDGSFKKFTRFLSQLATFAGTDDTNRITADHIRQDSSTWVR